MLLEFIARYYKVFWIVFGLIGFVKIILAYVFHDGLQGINGVLFALFKWYSNEEQEMEDIGQRRTTMRLLNVVTLAIYAYLALLLALTLLPMIIGR